MAAQHPDRPEADRGVAADRALVPDGGIDREPVVTAFVDEVIDHDAQRLASQAPVVEVGSDRDVEAGVAVLRLVFLAHLDEPDHVAVELDREALDTWVAEQLVPQPLLVMRSPPPDHLGLGDDRRERRDVRRDRPSQQHPLAAERQAWVRSSTITGMSRWVFRWYSSYGA